MAPGSFFSARVFCGGPLNKPGCKAGAEIRGNGYAGMAKQVGGNPALRIIIWYSIQHIPFLCGAA